MPIEIIEAARKIDILVVVVAALCYFAGNIIILYPTIKKLAFEYQNKFKEERAQRKSRKQETDFNKDLRYMLTAAGGEKISAATFKTMTGFLFIIMLALTFRTVNPVMALFFSCLVGGIPFLILKMKITHLRNTASNEAEDLISDLLIQYRIAGFAIEEALEKVIAKNKDIPNTKPLLYRMLQTIRSTRNKQEIRDAVNMFSYTVGTNWAKMLSHNIYAAGVNSINISLSIEDILIQLRDARMLAEERKRINSESTRMFWLIPLSYVGTIVASVVTMDMSVGQFFRNQFGSVIGIVFFIIVLVLSVVCYVLISMTKQQRFDF